MFRLIMAPPAPAGYREINPDILDMEVLWRGGWRITDFVQPYSEGIRHFNEWRCKERDYLARLQQQHMMELLDLNIRFSGFNTPPESSSSDHYVIEPVKDGDSQKTQLTSSKGKNTFKAFIQRTMNTA